MKQVARINLDKFLHQKRMERVGRLIKRLCKPEQIKTVK